MVCVDCQGCLLPQLIKTMRRIQLVVGALEAITAFQSRRDLRLTHNQQMASPFRRSRLVCGAPLQGLRSVCLKVLSMIYV